MSKTLRIEITYKRLGQTLTRFGFIRNDGDSFIAFCDESHGALIVLPSAAPDEQVSERHLIAVEKALEGKGVAAPDRFYAVLTNPAGALSRAPRAGSCQQGGGTNGPPKKNQRPCGTKRKKECRLSLVGGKASEMPFASRTMPELGGPGDNASASKPAPSPPTPGDLA